MPRRRRYLPAGLPAHIIQRGNNRMDCFASTTERKALAHWLNEGANRYGVSIHAWVFMSNHIHLLATPEEDHAISGLMQFVGRHYVPWYNHHHQRTGTLFEGRFRSHPVQTTDYFLRCSRYIELNPVRAGLVDDPSHHVWSSYAANACGASMQLWQPHAEYLALGVTASQRRDAYRALFDEQLDEQMLKEIRHAIKTGFVLGSETYRQRFEKITGIPQRYQRRGRKKRML